MIDYYDLAMKLTALKVRADEIRKATNWEPDSYMVPARAVEPHLSVTVYGKPITLTDGEWGLFYEVKA